MGRKSKSGVEIHRRLADGQPDDVVARSVGLKERVIRNHRASRCKCAIPRPEAVHQPAVALIEPETIEPETVAVIDVGNPVAVATKAYAVGVSPLAIAAALGVDAYRVDPDSGDFGLAAVTVSSRRLERLAATAETLRKMQLHRPAQWTAWVARQDDGETMVAMDSRLPRETWTGFFGAVISHQANILTEDDFRDWVQWVDELAINRFPAMRD